ncbi:MAG: stage III sporulation protein AE [Christensenellaceae bacterium]|jgi:stage III sporulation protein AE|nr:stage III sporulation protein AE [Christensenellaceae bacterium]
MKKIIVFFTILLVFSQFLCQGSTAYAESKSIEDELDDEIKNGLDALINNELENFFSDINIEEKYKYGQGFRNVIEKILSGQTIGLDDAFNIILGGIGKNIKQIISYLITIIILSILFGVTKNLNSSFLNESTSQIVYYAIYGTIITVLCVIVNDIIISAKGVISTIGHLSEISFPILLTLITAVGGSATATVYQPMTFIITNVVMKINEHVILPIFIACIVFTIIGNLTRNIKLAKFTQALQSIAKWTLGIMFGTIVTIITAHGIVGASIDSVSIRSTKFALSAYVPILGGYLSDGFDIVIAGAIVMKNAIGLGCVIVLFLSIIGHVIKIIVTSLLIKLIAGIIEPIADERISQLLYSISKHFSIIISIVLGSAFLVMVTLMSVICAFNVGVI